MFLGFNANATRYYVSSSSGDDNNDGLTPEKAWKTIGKVSSYASNFVPGDIIAFKRGDVWNDEKYYSSTHSSGTSVNPITYTAYGTGAKPIFNVHTSKPLSWTSLGSNKWSAPTSLAPRRVFKNGTELLMAQTFGLLGTDGSGYFSESSKITVYSTTNPNLDTFSWSNFTYIIYFDNVDYITWDNIDFRGGHNSSIQIRKNNSNWVIKNCNIGKNASEGVVIQNSNYITIEDNNIDANFIVDMSRIVPGGTGVDWRSCGDGVTMYNGVNNCIIRNNTFKNWGHAAFAGQTDNSSSRITNNKVYGNDMSTPDILYGRAIGYSGYFEDNEIYNNYIHNTSTTNQLGGSRNHFHHNIIDGVLDSPLKSSPLGIGIKLENYNVRIEDNIIENNVIANTESEGILIYSINEDKSTGEVSGNIIRNNIIYNCGTSSSNVGIQFHEDKAGQSIYNNKVENNLIYNSNTTKTYRYQFKGSIQNASDFNKQHESLSNNIEGNPMLIDINKQNYRIKVGSPAEGAATTVLAKFDYYGNKIGTNPNIGVY